MLNISLHRKLIMLFLLTIFVSGLLLGYTFWIYHAPNSSHAASHGNTPTLSPSHTSITISKAQDLFMPFLLVVQLHTTVIWHNDDSRTHIITTTAQQSNFLNREPFSLHAKAGQSVQFMFNQAGLYHYYDTTMSSWNTQLARVAANKGTAHFPLAMDGIIWVQGSIGSLPTVALNHIPNGHDEFASEFLAISQLGGITWHNFDSDSHFIGLAAGWSAPINPIDIGLHRIAGTDEVVGGATTTILFTSPGLYYYYCRNHDQIDPLTHRVEALPMASEYPIPMEGFVLVLPR